MKKTIFRQVLFLVSIITSTTLLMSCRKNSNVSENKNKFDSSYPQRIVSLSPAATEILYDIGAFNQICARSDFSDYPPEVTTIPVAGGFDGKNISIETVLSFEPDFLYLTSGMHDYLIPLLKAKKIKYYISTDSSVKGILSEIRQVGKITGHEKQAEEVAKKMEREIEFIKANSPSNKKSVYWEIWSPPYMSVGENSFINELIEISGGNNIFNDINEAYPIVSEEQIIAREPEIIIIPDNLSESPEQIKNRNGWATIPAIKNDKIFALDSNLISRPSPRIIQALELIQKCMKD